MKINAKLLVVAFILAIFSVGAVAASENVTLESSDLTQVPHEPVVSVPDSTVLEVEAIDLETCTDDQVSSSSDEINVTGSVKESLKKSNGDSLLGASDGEETLGSTVYVDGNYFQNLRNAIDSASIGDVVDLEGKTIIGSNPVMNVNKRITIANGVLDAQFLGNAPRNSFNNVILNNITIINYNIPFLITNSELNDVRFDNIETNGGVFVIRNSKLTGTDFTNCRSLMAEDPDDYETGVVIVTYNSVYDRCNFINDSSNRHSGAICVGGANGNTVNITNSNFINCSAGIGGAIYVHGNDATNPGVYSNIINCKFINNTASQYGGAVGSSQTYLNIQDCEFINNTAKKGAAIMVGGISHGLDGNLEGHYNIINNCYFHNNTGTEEGGAVHITGDNNKAVDCYFDDNFAHNGNGAAIYVKGENATVINSEFYNHDCEKGTVYIEGEYAKIFDSKFKNNTASKGGAGVYIDGNYPVLDNNIFINNNATIHGGAIHTHGDHVLISNSQFQFNNAIPDINNKDQGLGGAIYIRGDNNAIENCSFDHNTARNGSAIYNIGTNLHLSNDYFINNQAWSYLLFTVIKPNTTSYYNESADTIVEITHIGGDNIINAIHNAGSIFDIFFHNVTYYHSEGVHTTTDSELHPVAGVENSQGATILYQDDREDSQVIDVIVSNDESGNVIYDSRGSDLRTGLYGNLTINLGQGLRPGNYTVNATHPDDYNYTAITNITHFEILPHVDISVTKISDKDVYFVGENAVFTIRVYGVGTNATNVTVRDILPASLKFVSAKATQGSYDNRTDIWDIGFLPHGASQTLTLTVKTTELGIFDNVVNVTCTEKDWDLSNNVDNKTIRVELYYTKKANVTQTSAGEYIEYYLRVYNVGASDYTEIVRVHDILPEGVRYTGQYSLTGADLVKYVGYADEQIWEITNILADSHATITVKVQAIKDGIWNNTMQVWDYPPVNETVNVSSNADLRVIKEVSTQTANKGDLVKWTIFVKNEGPSIAMGAYLDDILPKGLEIYGLTNASKGSYNRGTGRWTIGDMAVGESQTLVITTRVTVSGTSITNNATVNSTTPDPNPDNNFDNATVNVTPEGDVSIEKIVSSQTSSHGSIVSWTINVTNNGPDKATGVYVIDKLPAGLEYINSTRTKGSAYNIVSGKWTIGEMDVKESATLVINTRVTSYDMFISNNATVYSTSVDTNPDNNYDENFTRVHTEADVGIVKLVSNQTAHLGDEIVWTIVVTNHGPNLAENVVVIDYLPYNDLIQTKAPYKTKGQVSHEGLTGRWDIGNLEVNETVYLEVYTKVLSSNKDIINVVQVTSDTYDPNPSNNRAENGTYVPPEADVSVVKTVNNLTPNKFDTVIWTISVINHGPDIAENVVVRDVLPKGLTYVSHERPTQGDFRHNSGEWTIGTLEVESRQTLKITTVVADTGTITNEVNVSSSTYDVNLKNNYDNETINVPAVADLEIIKIVSNRNSSFGDRITWTITVTNKGPETARNVVVNDTLPEGLVYITHSGPGLYDSVNGIWQIGDLANPESASLIITTLVNVTNATITNVAVVTSTTPDSNETNNEANNTTSVGPLADLAIEKTVDRHNPKKEDIITWTITVTNNGPDVAVNAVVKDIIPNGLTYEDFSATLGEYYHATSTWKIGNLTNGQSEKLYVRTKVDVTQAVITNIANVTSDTPDPDRTNNEDNSTIDVGHEADLEVIKTVSNSTPEYGDEITWNITVINHGPDSAVDVFVNDNLPAGLIWIEDDGKGSYNHVTGIWTIGTLNNQNKVTLIIKTKVNVTSANITNVAVVDSDTHDPNKDNNEDNDTIKVKSIADLVVVKEVSNKRPHFGEEITWTITVTNNGPSDAHDVNVTDKLPYGLIYKTDDSNGRYNSTTGIWMIGDLANTESKTLTIKTIVNITNATITNVAVVSSSTPDKNESNNKANNTTHVDPEVDLEIIKLVSGGIAHKGDTVTWTITVTNKGPDTAVNVYVSDELPKGLTVTGYSKTKGLFDADSLTWFIASLKKGESQNLTLYTLVNVTNKTLINNVSVTNDVYDPNETNNHASNNTTIPPEADLEVIKTAANSTYKNGDVVEWNITIVNHGPDDASKIYIVDVAQNGLVFINTDGSYFQGNVITGLLDITLAKGESVTLYVKTLVNATNTTLLNDVAVLSLTTSDPNPDNNQDNDTVEILPQADVVVEKLVSSKMSKKGDEITWTVTVTNNGPDTSVNTRVTDKLPAGLIYNGHDADKGTNYDPETGLWIVGDLANGESKTLEIKSIVNITNKTIINVANVTSDTPGNKTNGTNNTTSAPKADLVVVKEVSNKNPKFGEEITWTVTVTNNGPDAAVNVKVTDKLPEGLIFIASSGSYDNSTGVWTVGDLAKGESKSLVITTLVNITNKTIENVANATSDTPGNTTPGNNTTDVGSIADLQVIKLVSNSTAKKGDIVTWTIVVTNNGPDVAVNVKVTDKLPDGLIYNGHDADVGLYDPSQGIWTVGDMAKGDSYELVISTIVGINNGTIENVAVVSSSTPDNNTGNNKANNTTDVDENADLEIIKLVSNSTAKKGDIVTWTITVTNKGPNTSKNVNVTDKLPAGLIYKAHKADVGLYDPSQGVWIIGDMAKGESKSLVISTVVDINNGTIENIAVVSSSTPDNNTGNNKANNTTNVIENADLEIVKVVSNRNAIKGETVTWTITVTNNGPSEARNVKVTDKLPAGLIFTGSNGAYDKDSGIWTVGDLANGESKSLVITTVVNVTNATITNIANVTSDTPDSNKTNNEANNTTYVRPEADLSIIKTVSNSNPKKGDIITWTIVVTNNGPDSAVNVRIVDEVPAGLLVVVDGRISNTRTVTVEIPELKAGMNSTFDFKTLVDITNATITNVAVADSTVYDPNKTNNEDNESIDVSAEADLSIVKLVSSPTSHKGDIVTWTVIVTNNGPDVAKNIYVNDILPNELVYKSHKADKGIFDSNKMIWFIASLENGESQTLTVDTLVNATNRNITNVVNVTSDTPDSNKTNNVANNTTDVPPEADIGVVKEVNATECVKDQIVEWTITMTNYGPDGADNVIVKDNLPDTLIFISADGNYNPNTGIWTVGHMASGETKVLTILTKINTEGIVIVNNATAQSGTYDPNIKNNNASNSTKVIEIKSADLQVTKVVSDAKPHKGDIITWTITVKNNGPDTAENVTVSDKLPKGLTFLSADGNYDADTGIWTVGKLANGESKTLLITTSVDVTNANITNVAVANSTTQDNNTDNNRDNDTAEISPEADVKVVKTVSNPKPYAGDVITWTIVVSNFGPDAAENVIVEDIMPEGLQLISAKGSKGKFLNEIWTVGDMKNGEIETLTLTTRVTKVGAIENVVIAKTSTYDPNETNNRDNEVTNAKEKSKYADLELTKVANVEKVKVGDLIVWTITVINHGPDKAVGVYVQDILDAGDVEFISADSDVGEFDEESGMWDIGDMEVGDIAILTITVRALAEGDVINYAEVVSETPDPNPENNYDYCTVNVIKDNDSPDPGVPENPRPSTPTMHATGNPVVMAVLALLAVVCAGLRRKH